MSVPYRKKLIEVALPLEAINRESAREKSIRQGSGHPSTLHIWWARRPLAITRATLFAQLVDDPSAWPERFPTIEQQENERSRLFRIIEAIAPWEAATDERVIGDARREIARSWARSHPSKESDRILSDAVTADEVNRYLSASLPPVCDPFAGGGAIPLEAQRLGLRVIASDLNPVAVLINKALLEIPPRFVGVKPITSSEPEKKSNSRRTVQRTIAVAREWKGAQGLAYDLRYYGDWLRSEALARIGRFFPSAEITKAVADGRPELKDLVGERPTVIAWLWARTVRSPDPAFGDVAVPLISTYWLCSNKGKEAWIEPIVDVRARTYDFAVRTGPPANKEETSAGTKVGRGANFRCLLSGAPIVPEHVRSEGQAGRLGQRLMAVAVEGRRGRFYLPPSLEMEEAASRARPSWFPEEEMARNPRWFSPPEYGMPRFGDLFTSRQLLALTTFSDLVLEARQLATAAAREAGMNADGRSLHSGGSGAVAYGDAIAVYLAFARNLLLDDLVTQATWRPTNGGGSLGHAFSRQAIPMTWDFPEANPFADAAGDPASAIRSVSLCLEKLYPHVADAKVRQLDATATVSEDAESAVLSTDPPYFDNIGYADLADFFYVWLRHTLRDVYPQETSTLLSPKSEELIASPYRQGGKEEAQSFFLNGMTRALQHVAGRSVFDFPTTIYYAFKQAESDDAGVASTGWEVFLESVLAAGLAIRGTWPARSERLHGLKQDINALSSSVILVCSRKVEGAPATTRRDLRRLLVEELPHSLRALRHGKIAPVDVAQAAIGPGMAVFSRFSRVLEPSGEPMTIRAALQLINEVLDEQLTHQEGDLDPDTRFAVTWYEVHAFEAGPYGEAETLAKARAVAVSGIAEAGILKSGGGKVRLIARSELPDDWDPRRDKRLTTWEATQHLIKRLEERGEEAAATLLDQLGSRADAARDLAYRLFSTCERKGWAEEARAYNGLVVVWGDLERLAAARASEPSQRELL